MPVLQQPLRFANNIKRPAFRGPLSVVDKPSHSLSGLRVGTHESNIRSAPMLGLPRLQGFSITLKGMIKSQNKKSFWNFINNLKGPLFAGLFSQTGLFCFAVKAGNFIPVHDVPECFNVIWTAVLVIQVVCVLPYVKT